jgi:hypothetical protein
MAKCKAHGYEIGAVEFLTTAKRYMSDGVILKNAGFGWKRHSACKPNVNPETAYKAACERAAAFLSIRPDFAAYKKALHDLAGLGKRWKLHTAVTMMPGDADGVWSEACDGYGDNVHADPSEISELCDLYAAAVREAEALKQPIEA